MIIFVGLFQLTLICITLYVEFRKKSAAVFLWATLLAMFGVPNLLYCIYGNKSYDNFTLFAASVFVIAFTSLYLFVRISTNTERLVYDKFFLDNNTTGFNKFYLKFISIFVVLVILLQLYLYVGFVGSILATSWGAGREFSAARSYLNIGQPLEVLYFTFSGILLFAIFEKYKKIASSLSLSYVLFVVITRNRIEVLPLLTSVAAYFVLRNKRINTKTLLLFALCGCISIYLVYALRVFRHYGTIADFVSGFNFADFNQRISTHLSTGNGELGLLNWFYFYIYNNNNFENFNRGHGYIRMLLVYLPTRWSLGLKPPDFAISMGHAVGMLPGGSVHPTLFGDCFANFNYFGMLMGVFWAYFVKLTDKIYIYFAKRNFLFGACVYILMCCYYVIIGRGSVYNPFTFVAYGLPFVYLLQKFIFNKKIKFLNEQ